MVRTMSGSPSENRVIRGAIEGLASAEKLARASLGPECFN